MPSSTYYAVLLALVLGVGCGGGKEKVVPKSQPKVEAKNPEPPKATPQKLIADPIVDMAIRMGIGLHSQRELTETDLGKVTYLYFNLYFDATKLTDAVLKDVVKLQKLTKLSLNDTQITDAGLKEVAKLEKLTFLDLGSTQITDARLMEVAKLQQLEKLDLLFCEQITDAGLMEVDKLQNLKLLIHPGIDMTD